MNNICTIELIPKQNGNFFYSVTIVSYNPVGQLLPYEGNPCGKEPCDKLIDYEQAQSITNKINNLKNNEIYFNKTETKYEGISHKDIRNFLFKKTGLSRTDKLVLLYKIWALGKSNPSITFQFSN